jgi:hypothetical protein
MSQNARCGDYGVLGNDVHFWGEPGRRSLLVAQLCAAGFAQQRFLKRYSPAVTAMERKEIGKRARELSS